MSDTATLIDDIKTYMGDAQAMCERGEFIELQNLDIRVQQICNSIQELSATDAQHYSGELDSIMESLGTLQQMFEAKRAALGEELNETHKHSKAAKAYTQSDLSAPQEG